MLNPQEHINHKEKTASSAEIFFLIWFHDAAGPSCSHIWPAGIYGCNPRFFKLLYYALMLILCTVIIKMQLSVLATK